MLPPVTNEFEKALCENVFKCERQLEEAIYEAAKYFASKGRYQYACHLLVRFADFTMDQEKDAFFRLTAGQVAEHAGDLNVAADEYRKGLENKISDEETAYFLNNNLGYTLIQIGKFDEAERYCREAIAIDSTRFNAHKNLGLALHGQEKYLEAAIALKKASLLSKDSRAGKHLKELLKEHPEIKESFKQVKIVNEGYALIQNISKLDC